MGAHGKALAAAITAGLACGYDPDAGDRESDERSKGRRLLKLLLEVNRIADLLLDELHELTEGMEGDAVQPALDAHEFKDWAAMAVDKAADLMQDASRLREYRRTISRNDTAQDAANPETLPSRPGGGEISGAKNQSPEGSPRPPLAT